MLLVFGSLGNPAANDGFFRFIQTEVAVGRRHQLIGIFVDQTPPHFAAFRLSWYDYKLIFVFFQSLKKPFFGIEAQISFSLLGIRPMTLEAAVGKNGLDVEIKINNIG